MDIQKPSIKPIAYTYGLYLALLSILGLVILYVLNIEKSWIMSGISFVLTIIIYVYGIGTFKKQNGNSLSIKDALKVGLAMAVVSGIIAAIYTVIHYEFIQPEFIENIRENAYLEMTKQNPNMTEDQLATATKMTNMFTSKFFMATMYLVASLFFGFLISLVAGAIMKKE
ncbi:DUF4199 domain-containing protein [Flavobacteriaceae bacterium 144Ye]|jgi:hypothetical protein|uniref:DUF4199 domain-containing protein n=1 Tax=Gaetbulibacter TaxID=311207 RepID=UPI00101CED14|nr:DUF4199 domain-containing protein [Flavobacteriaceae bacterium 144Ye]